MARATSSLRRQFLVATVVAGLLTGLPGVLLPAGQAGSVEDARRKVQRMADALEAAEDEVAILSEDLVTAQNDRDTLEIEIVATEAEIATKQAELDGVYASAKAKIQAETDSAVAAMEKESEALLKLLFAHATRPEFSIRWRWQENDVAFWDNRVTQHFAVDDYRPSRRVMHRAAILGDAPF